MIFNKHIINIKKLILDYFSPLELDEKIIQVQETKKEFEGDWTVVLFPLQKFTKKTINDFANELGDYLLKNDKTIKSFNIVSGFLNLELTDNFWLDILEFSFLPNFELNQTKNATIVWNLAPQTQTNLYI